jgi:hypothetical protein
VCGGFWPPHGWVQHAGLVYLECTVTPATFPPRATRTTCGYPKDPAGGDAPGGGAGPGPEAGDAPGCRWFTRLVLIIYEPSVGDPLMIRIHNNKAWVVHSMHLFHLRALGGYSLMNATCLSRAFSRRARHTFCVYKLLRYKHYTPLVPNWHLDIGMRAPTIHRTRELFVLCV